MELREHLYPAPSRPCPKARKWTGRRKRGVQREHPAHTWWAGAYYPVGDMGYPAWCPGWSIK